MSEARVVQVIATDSLLGQGTKDSPYTRQAELWSLNGRLLATFIHGTEQNAATAEIANL